MSTEAVETVTVVDEQGEVQVVTVGATGPQGPQGPEGPEGQPFLGPLGGVLAGMLPDPTFAVAMATQGNLDAETAARIAADAAEAAARVAADAAEAAARAGADTAEAGTRGAADTAEAGTRAAADAAEAAARAAADTAEAAARALHEAKNSHRHYARKSPVHFAPPANGGVLKSDVANFDPDYAGEDVQPYGDFGELLTDLGYTVTNGAWQGGRPAVIFCHPGSANVQWDPANPYTILPDGAIFMDYPVWFVDGTEIYTVATHFAPKPSIVMLPTQARLDHFAGLTLARASNAVLSQGVLYCNPAPASPTPPDPWQVPNVGGIGFTIGDRAAGVTMIRSHGIGCVGPDLVGASFSNDGATFLGCHYSYSGEPGVFLTWNGDPNGGMQTVAPGISYVAPYGNDPAFPSHTITSVDTVANKITAAGSAYVDGKIVAFTGQALPGGLSSSVFYFVVGAVGTTFGVSLTAGGPLVDLTSAGSGTRTIKVQQTNPALYNSPNAWTWLSCISQRNVGTVRFNRCKGGAGGHDLRWIGGKQFPGSSTDDATADDMFGASMYGVSGVVISTYAEAAGDRGGHLVTPAYMVRKAVDDPQGLGDDPSDLARDIYIIHGTLNIKSTLLLMRDPDDYGESPSHYAGFFDFGGCVGVWAIDNRQSGGGPGTGFTTDTPLARLRFDAYASGVLVFNPYGSGLDMGNAITADNFIQVDQAGNGNWWRYFDCDLLTYVTSSEPSPWAGATGVSVGSLLTAQGSLITADPSITPVEFPIGTDGQVLRVNGTALQWHTIIHADLGNVSSDQHHARSHDHHLALDGQSLSPSTLILPQTTVPAETAEGSIVWDTNDDQLTVGDGVSRKIMAKVGDAPSAHAASHAPGGTDSVDGSYATDADVTAEAAARAAADAAHAAAGDPHPAYATDADLAAHVAAGDPHSVYATDVDLTTHAGLPDVHHAHATATDGEHTVSAGQVVAGVDAAAAQKGHVQLGGDLAGSGGTAAAPALTAVGPGATGPIGDATHTPQVTIDAKGRVTALASVTVTGVTPAGHHASHEVAGSDVVAITHAQTTGQTANDHHAQAHGASDHTDITRSIFVFARVGSAADSATAGSVGSAPDTTPVFQCADAATQGVAFLFGMPADAKAASAINFRPVWLPGSTDASAHTARFSADVLALTAGVAGDAAGTTTAWTGDSAARTAKQAVYETGTQVLASCGPGDVIRADLRRVGGDAADTYVGIVNLVGVWVDYSASQ